MVRETVTDAPSYLVFVPSFNRPRFAEALLRELVAQSAGRRVAIQFRDDCSDCDYASVREFARKHADIVTYQRNSQNRSRDGLWRTYNEILKIARVTRPDYLIVLQDHSRIVPDFFGEVHRIWSAIPDANKTVINLPRDAKAFHRWWSPVFHSVLSFGGVDVVTSGWIDGSWVAGAQFLDRMTGDLEPPGAPLAPKEPYRGHPTLHQLAQKVRSGGGSIYTPTKILAPPASPRMESPSRAIHVFIPTYNRPENLLILLRQIEEESEGYKVAVDVFNDASTADYSAVERWIASAKVPITMHRHEENRGKRGFWKTFNDIFRIMTSSREDSMVILQDDAEICTRFFDAIWDYWNAIADERKIAMNVQRNNLGDGQIWQAKEGTLMSLGGRQIWFSGWFDGMWFGTRDTLEALSYCVHAMDPRRWDDDPMLSSGVGQQLTDRLNTAGYNIYMPFESLVRMIPGKSFMNPEARAKLEIREINFRGRYDGGRGSVS